MDLNRDLRRQVIQALQERKNEILRQAEQEANALRDAARLAPEGAAKQAAYGEWHRHQRDVLFPAHIRAQEIDQQILELMQLPMDRVRRMAQRLGIVVEAAPEETIEQRPPERVSARRTTPAPMPRRPAPGPAPVLPVGRETAPDAPVAPELARQEPVAPTAAEPDVTVAAPEPETADAPPPIPVELAQAAGDVQPEVVAARAVPGEQVSAAARRDTASGDIAGVTPTAPPETAAVPPIAPTPETLDLPPQMPEEEPEPIAAALRSQAAIKPPLIAILGDEEWLAAEPIEPAVPPAELPEVAAAQPAPTPEPTPEPAPPPRRCPQCDKPILASDAVCPYCGCLLAAAPPAPVPIWRRWPAWLVPALAGLAAILAISTIVLLVMNRRTGREIAGGLLTATPEPTVAIVAATATPISAFQSPLAVADTATPPQALSETPTAAPTPQPPPVATEMPSPTEPPTPEATATTAPTPTAEPTATPPTPQVLVNGTYNVRSGPGTAYPTAGQVSAGQVLDIVARNADSTWWQVCCVAEEPVWIRADLAPAEGPTDDVVVATEIPTPPPAPPPAPVPAVAEAVPGTLAGRIAFPVFDTGRRTYDLYVANTDGTSLQRVLDEASQPALSPDGQRIAFRNWSGTGRGITIMYTYGGNLLKYSKFHEDALPSWRADGQALVYFSRRESDRKPRLYIINLVDRNENVITRDREPVFGEWPVWLADGSIVYRFVWPQAGLAIMNPDGLNERVLVLDDSARAPAASPDSTSIAFMSQRDGNWEIYRIGTDGSGLTRLTDNAANDGLPAWSPDGRTVAFASDRGGGWAVWAMTPSGQGQRQLFAMPGSPDGIMPDQPEYTTRGWAEERLSWAP